MAYSETYVSRKAEGSVRERCISHMLVSIEDVKNEAGGGCLVVSSVLYRLAVCSYTR